MILFSLETSPFHSPWKVLTPVPMKVTLFGNRDFVDIIKYDYPYKTRRRDTDVGKMAM